MDRLHSNPQLILEKTSALEYYGWDGDRLAFTKDQSNQWHYLYEPDSFTPMMLIRQDGEPERSEGQQALTDNLALLLGAPHQMPGGQAGGSRQLIRDQIIATLKEQNMWQDPEVPQDCYFYHCNHLGLPEALTGREGQVVWAAEYDPWGNLQSEHNPNKLKQQLRLPGQYHDPESGLYYNRHRYYDPALGSYISQDPIGLDSGEPNFYAYPKNPLQGMDPLGLEADKAKKSPFSDVVGDVVRDSIINGRSAQHPNIWDSAVKHACENNGRIMECMRRLDEYEAALKLDKSVGRYPVIQGLVELGREAGKEHACIAINICDLSEYQDVNPKFHPRVQPPKLEEILSGN